VPQPTASGGAILDPETRDRRLYDAAVAFRAGRYDTAEAAGRALLAAAPEFFPALLLLGMVAGKTGRPAEGIALLRRAVARDRRSADARNELAGLLRSEGRAEEAVTEAKHAVRLQPEDPGSHNNLGLCHLAVGRAPLAITHFQRALALKPDAAMFHHNLGLALQQQARDLEAIAAYRRALDLDGANAQALAHLGQLLLQHGEAEEGTRCYERAAELQPDPTLGALHRAEALLQAGRAAEAEACLRRAVAADPGSDLAHQVLGVLLQRRGRFDEAAASFARAIELQPKRISAYLSLVMGKRVGAADRSLLDAMLALLDDPLLTATERSRLHYALGKAYDDLADYASASRHFDRANEIEADQVRRAGRGFDRKGHKTVIDRIIAGYPAALFAQRPASGSQSELPVLIVGMPRSGTTLVEQILSSHRDVGAAGELSYWTDRQALSAPAAAVGRADLVPLAEDYLALLRRAAPAARRVTDKMPGNFLVLGLVHLVLPGARVIHIRRDPIDTCLSIYQTAFGNPLDFAHDRSDLAFFYREYERLMAHWRAVLPSDRFFEIDYEALVADPERVSRAMIDFCGLEWDEACLAPEANEHVIMTPSLWQARQPVNRGAVARWRKYENWLGALRRLSDPPP
jgi:tetratricopeptide (TPR) repeat protein